MFNKDKNSKNNPADEIELQNLRTYEDDVKSAIQTDNVSSTKILLAEQEKKESLDSKEKNSFEKEPITPETKKIKISKSKMIIGLSTVLVILGSFVIYYNFSHIKPYFENLTGRDGANNVGVLIPNESIIIESLGKTKGEIVNKIQKIISTKHSTHQNEIIEISINKHVTTETELGTENKIVQITSSDLFNLLNARASDPLKRSLMDKITLGIHVLDDSEPFIIFKSDNIHQTYSGLLDWEKDMGSDLQDIFYQSLTPPKDIDREDIITQNNGTSSDEVVMQISDPLFDLKNFSDLIISNKDARVIVDSSGKIRFFYSIVDNEHIIMTTNKKTLDLLLNRINQVKLIR